MGMRWRILIVSVAVALALGAVVLFLGREREYMVYVYRIEGPSEQVGQVIAGRSGCIVQTLGDEEVAIYVPMSGGVPAISETELDAKLGPTGLVELHVVATRVGPALAADKDTSGQPTDDSPDDVTVLQASDGDHLIERAVVEPAAAGGRVHVALADGVCTTLRSCIENGYTEIRLSINGHNIVSRPIELAAHGSIAIDDLTSDEAVRVAAELDASNMPFRIYKPCIRYYKETCAP